MSGRRGRYRSREPCTWRPQVIGGCRFNGRSRCGSRGTGSSLARCPPRRAGQHRGTHARRRVRPGIARHRLGRSTGRLAMACSVCVPTELPPKSGRHDRLVGAAPAEALQLRFGRPTRGAGQRVAAQERQSHGRGHVGERDAAPGQKACSVLVNWLAAATRASRERVGARTGRMDGIGSLHQRSPAMAVAEQHVGQQVRVAGVALGATAGATRSAGLDGVGVA